MWNGCKGISIGYFSQPVEGMLKQVLVGYVEGEKVEPKYGLESVRETEKFVEVKLQIKEGECVSLQNTGKLFWCQAWSDGTIWLTIYKDGEGANNEHN